VSKISRPEASTKTQAKIGNRIRRAREMVEPNRAAFARLLELDRSTLAKIEAGSRAPSIFNVIDIAHRLRVTADYILRGSLRGIDGELAARLVAADPEILADSRKAINFDT
jgi:transcriptional regulator with XRE-family HTH domain